MIIFTFAISNTADGQVMGNPGIKFHWPKDN